MNTNYLELQNGSDIRGVATDGFPGENINLTPEITEKIAVSFAHWLSRKISKPLESITISVGMDSRISGTLLKQGFIKGLVFAGVNAIDCGLASTPAMFMSTILPEYACDGAAMLTASHLPFNRNGIKLFSPDGGLNKKDITEILTHASSVEIKPISEMQVEKRGLISAYAAYLANIIRKSVNHPVNYENPLTGFHIVVDAGNGAGGFYANEVLLPLGADISGSQFLEPDGMFPNHIPNPEDDRAMEFIQKAVLANHADLGIIFDTDVDRAAIVDNFGNSINRNKLIALIGAIVLDEHPNTTIVTDSITSDGLTGFIEKNLQGRHHRYKRGYKNVINEAIRLNNEGVPCWLAIETSGHAALKENYFLDDGAYLITKILIKAVLMKLSGGKGLTEIIDNLKQPVESHELRFKIVTSDFKEYGNRIITELIEYVKTIPEWGIVPNNFEGLRVSCGNGAGNGWFLLRLSLHDPVIPLNIESDVEGGTAIILNLLKEFLNRYPSLDITSLQAFKL